MTEIIEPASQFSISDYLSWIATAISIIGAFISIYQSFKIKNYRKEIITDLRKITVHKANDHLKKALADCRKLLNDSDERGKKIDEIYASIQESLDLASNELNQKDLDSDIRSGLEKADKELKLIRGSGRSANKLHEELRGAIVLCNQIIGEIK